MNVADALARLKGVRPCAGGHVACCPAHDDHHPSLSIREETARRDFTASRVVVTAGCAPLGFRARRRRCVEMDVCTQ